MDTQGHLLAVLVHAADVNEREGARWLLRGARRYWRTIQKLWADQGYTGDWADELRAEYGIELEIVTRTAEQHGFVVLSRRWVVERSLAWSGRSRRLSKEYEHWPEYSETVIYLASIHRLLKQLAPDGSQERPYTRKAA